MKDAIEKYLAARSLAWSPSTLKSERSRLLTLAPHINGDALQLWNVLQKHAPYPRVTAWTRVTVFWDWAVSQGFVTGANPYRAFRSTHQRLFKHAYQRQVPEISFEDAQRRIGAITDKAARDKALELLFSGMRWSESFTLNSRGQIRGKGGKFRQVYLPENKRVNYKASYATFVRRLATAGLTPHDLRKIALNRLVQVGADPFQLAEVAGWSSINTAQSYIKTQDSTLKNLVWKAMKHD